MRNVISLTSPSLERAGFYCLLLLVPYAAGLGCGRANSGQSAPEVLIEAENSHRLPVVFSDETEDIRQDFPVLNRTGHEVKFVRVVPSCTCAEAHVEQKTLSPGEQTVLHLRADLRQRLGEFQFSSSLVPDGRGEPWTYRVSAHVYPRVSFDPPQINWGRIASGAPKSMPAFIETFALHGMEQPKIVSVKTSSSALQAALSEHSTTLDTGDVDKQHLPLRVKLAPQTTPGPAAADIVVTYTYRGSPRESQMHVLWEVADLFAHLFRHRSVHGRSSPDPSGVATVGRTSFQD